VWARQVFSDLQKTPRCTFHAQREQVQRLDQHRYNFALQWKIISAQLVLQRPPAQWVRYLLLPMGQQQLPPAQGSQVITEQRPQILTHFLHAQAVQRVKQVRHKFRIVLLRRDFLAMQGRQQVDVLSDERHPVQP
jgi:hypothetical protein